MLKVKKIASFFTFSKVVSEPQAQKDPTVNP